MAGPADTIFIGDLPAELEEETLKMIFGAYGTLTSCKLLPASPSGSRAAIVSYATVDEAKWIVENLSGNIPEGLTTPVVVKFKQPAVKGDKGAGAGGKAWGGACGKGGGDAWGAACGKGGGDAWGAGWGASGGKAASAGPESPSDNLFMGNLPGEIDEPTLRQVFGAYGTIKQCKLLDANSVGMRSALIQYGSVEEAKWIRENLDGNLPEGLVGTDKVNVKYKSDKSQAYGKADGGKGGDDALGPYGGKGADGWGCKGGKDGMGKGKGKGKGCNIKTLVDGLMQSGAMPGGIRYSNDENTLFVAGLPSDTTDLDLFWIFSPFGAIAPKGVKAMMLEDGSCKGIGFVNMMDQTGSSAAVMTLHGTQMPDGTTLTVSQKREGGGKGKGEKDGGKGGKDGFKGSKDGGKW